MSQSNDDNPYRVSGGSLKDAAHTTTNVQLASRASRFVARLVDETIIFILKVITLIFLSAYDIIDLFPSLQDPQNVNPAAFIMEISIYLGYSALLGFVFYTLLNVNLLQQGQTIGKRLVSITMVNHRDFGKPSFVRLLLLREGLLTFCAFLFGIFIVINYIFIFAANRRCLHDLWSGTSVVDTESLWLANRPNAQEDSATELG